MADEPLSVTKGSLCPPLSSAAIAPPSHFTRGSYADDIKTHTTPTFYNTVLHSSSTDSLQQPLPHMMRGEHCQWWLCVCGGGAGRERD